MIILRKAKRGLKRIPRMPRRSPRFSPNALENADCLADADAYNSSHPDGRIAPPCGLIFGATPHQPLAQPAVEIHLLGE